MNQSQQETGHRASSATVADDGSFMVSTYEQSDGMPPGKYAACLLWLEAPQGGGMMVDRLRGKFMDPAKPFVTFEVLKETIDLGEIRLRTDP